jgi:putative IMPACT (imprinted ancient) family translation regulator
MSAYDNPTIIKDDSAMAWAKATSGFAESFKQSYDIARKEKEAKEKADKQQSIKDQTLLSQLEYRDQEAMQKGAEGLEKKGASPDTLTKRSNFIVDFNRVVAKNTLAISRDVLSKEDLEAKNKYASEVTTIEASLDRGLGATFSQVGAFVDGKVNVGNISDYVFNGDDLLSQGINKAVFLAFKFPNVNVAKKDLDYDVNKPLDARLDVQIPLANKEQLKEVFLAANATATTKEVDEAIAAGITNKSIIAEGAEGKETYTIKYNPKISEWTGEFYTEIPKINLGEISTTVGIYSKEGGNKITNNYLEPTKYQKLEGNANQPASEGTAKYQITGVNEIAVRESIRPSSVAQATGLITTYLKDTPSFNGILRKLDFGTDYPLKKFIDDHKETGMAGMVQTLAKRIEDKEWQNIIQKSDLKKIIDPKTKQEKYYVADAQSIAFFNKPDKTGGLTDAQEKAAANLEKNIKNVWDMTAEGSGNFTGVDNVKVSHSMGQFIIETPGELKGEIIEDKNDVVKYLRDAVYNPK